MIGKVLNDRYELLELIGRGGMAHVYKAKDRKLNRFVAVKILRAEYSEDEQFIKKFDRESQAAAGLTHPNIVSVYDVGAEEHIYYIVMEYVDGITLKQYLDTKGKLDYREATHFVLDIAEALKCAHAHQIIHRDVKPHNILLNKELVPKVGDFGIARAITSSTITMTNQTMGSVHYISPEQARGGFVDERSDLYSLGILFYELVTGSVPFDEENSVSIAIKHIQEDIIPPKEVIPELPQKINDIIIKLTEKKPENRYQSMEELIEEIRKLNLDGTEKEADLTDDYSDADTGLFRVESMDEEEPLEEEDAYVEPDEADEIVRVPAVKRKHKKRMIAIIIVALLLIGGTVSAIYYANSQKVVVPDIVDMSEADAETALEEVGLKLEVQREVYDDDIVAGNVVTQNPEKDEVSQKGRTVKVEISKGKENVTIPSVIGESENDAIDAIEALGLVVNKVEREYNSSYDPGIVYNIDPAEDTQVSMDAEITIYVSKGTETVTVPKIVGLSESEAKSAIEAAGLTVGSATEKDSDDTPEGTIISQSPESGTETEKNTAINYVVSSGTTKISVPNVVGLTQVSAEAKLESVGLSVGSVTTEDSDVYQPGYVISQGMGAGTQVEEGSKVDLSISSDNSSASDSSDTDDGTSDSSSSN